MAKKMTRKQLIKKYHEFERRADRLREDTLRTAARFVQSNPSLFREVLCRNTDATPNWNRGKGNTVRMVRMSGPYSDCFFYDGEFYSEFRTQPPHKPVLVEALRGEKYLKLTNRSFLAALESAARYS